MLKDLFYSLTGQYTNDHLLQEKLWQQIEKNYTDKKRYYHTLSHLESLVAELSDLRNSISNWNAVLFAVFYHDTIYRAHRKDNEEESARLAQKHLNLLNCDEGLVDQVNKLILATKSHQLSDDNDVNLFTDADLSILGKDWETYSTYFHQVRKEYSIYPDLLYKPGRKKALQHFLSMDRLFKTDVFFSKYETTARANLKNEIALL